MKDNIWNDSVTVKEVYQQPDCWEQTLKILNNNRQKIESFIDEYKNNNDALIIFSGAGTSEFVGNAISDYLSTYGWNMRSIASTDFVSNPEIYIHNYKKILIIHFARSGNSPESVATYVLMKQLNSNSKHLVITCNKEGNLAKKSIEDKKNTLCILLPNQTNDKGFAMTSSYSSMYLCAVIIFSNFKLKNNFEKIIKTADKILNDENILNNLEIVAQEKNIGRIIYLGSNQLKGIAQEASLKCLELSNGKVVTVYNSCLGFRHGPKAIVNNESLIIIMLSNNLYTRKYDIDLLKEIYKDNTCKKLIVLDSLNEKEIQKYCDIYFNFEDSKSDCANGLLFIIYAQLFALKKSIALNINPDNPNPQGQVNRVVKGVIIHKYN